MHSSLVYFMFLGALGTLCHLDVQARGVNECAREGERRERRDCRISEWCVGPLTESIIGGAAAQQSAGALQT